MQDDAVPPASSVEIPEEDLSSAIFARAKGYGEGILGANAGVNDTLVGGRRPGAGSAALARQSDSFAGSLQSLLTYREAGPAGGAQTPTARAASAPPLQPAAGEVREVEPEPAPEPPPETATDDGPGSWVRRLESAWDILQAQTLERDTAPDLESIGMPVEPAAEPPPQRGTGRRTRIQEAPGPVSIPAGRPAAATGSPGEPPAGSAPPTGGPSNPGTAPTPIQRTPAPEGSPPPAAPHSPARPAPSSGGANPSGKQGQWTGARLRRPGGLHRAAAPGVSP